MLVGRLPARPGEQFREYTTEPGQADGIVVRAQSTINNALLSAILVGHSEVGVDLLVREFSAKAPGLSASPNGDW
jgi:hypothetical protein